MAEIDANNKKAWKAAKVPLLKFCTIVVGYVVVQVGWHAHFTGQFNVEKLSTYPGKKECGAENKLKKLNETEALEFPGGAAFYHESYHDAVIKEECPWFTQWMEAIFVFNTVVYLVFSIWSLVTGLVCTIPNSKLQYHDKSIHMFGAAELIIGGILLIASAVLIHNWRDQFYKKFDTISTPYSDSEPAPKYQVMHNLDFHDKYLDKIVAGTFCLLLGFLYAYTSISIKKEGAPAPACTQNAPCAASCAASPSPSHQIDAEAGKAVDGAPVQGPSAPVPVQPGPSKTHAADEPSAPPPPMGFIGGPPIAK